MEAVSMIRCLRQVIPERSPEHIVDRVGRYRVRRIVGTRPTIAAEVGILDTPPNSTLRALVEAVPEAERCLIDVASVAGACATAGWSELVRGRRFRAATRVVRERRPVTTDSIRLDRGCRRRGDCRACSRTRNCRCLDYSHAVIASVCRTRRVLAAIVCVNIQLLGGVELETAESAASTDQCFGAIRPERQVSQLSRGITSDAVAVDALCANIQFLGKQWNKEARAPSSACASVVERTRCTGCGGSA